MSFFSSAQNSIIPPAFSDININLPVNTSYYHMVNCDINNDGTNVYTAVVVEDQNAFGVVFQIELILYNGTSSNVITISPATLSIPSPYSFSFMSNPDIVLLNGGSKAIITFDTDDANYGAYWAEFDLNFSTLTATQNTTFYGGAVPITHLSPGFSHNPKVDRSSDGSTDMFVVVALQDYYANGAEVPVLTYFEDNSFSYIYPDLSEMGKQNLESDFCD